jgi:hypothetical protein
VVSTVAIVVAVLQPHKVAVLFLHPSLTNLRLIRVKAKLHATFDGA